MFQGLAVEAQTDFFAPAKAVATLAAGGLAVLALIRARRGVPRAAWWAFGVYLAAVWVSAILANDRSTALFGSPHQSEGALALTAYGALALLATTVRSGGRALLAAILGAAAVAWTLGIAEYCGAPLLTHDLLGRPFFWLAPGTIVSTLAHGNTVGSYAALVVPLAFGLFLRSKRAPVALALAALTVLGAANAFGSMSRGGMIGAAVGALVALIAAWRTAPDRACSRRALLVVLAAGTAIYLMTPFVHRQLTAKSDLATVIGADLARGAWDLPLEILTVDGHAAHVRWEGQDLRVYAVGDRILLTDAEGHPVAHAANPDGTLRLADARYARWILRLGADRRGKALEVDAGPYAIPLVVAPDSVRLAVPGGTATTEEPRLARPPSKWDLVFSGRGYIWNRTLPLLASPRKLLIGSGPGAFGDEFPQRDFAGKLNAYFAHQVLVDKPHNLYLQIAHASGFASLLALAVVWFLALTGPAPPALKGALAGYLVSGLATDSFVGVAPTFWILVGLALHSLDWRGGELLSPRENAAAGRAPGAQSFP